jgi:putative transcriptional regulator
MTTARKPKSCVLRDLLETANDLRKAGVMSKPEFSRIEAACVQPPDYSPTRVARIRTRKAKMSQAVFASVLNVTTSTVQKWESPASGKRPSGAAAKLLQLVEAKGIEALLVD